ncbi:hypothetical protein FACS1894163_13740 [Spirochaetia bacterium]|nr:hypothetical protein FACS1894163_13740 [Spirochaetia bacterium]
MLQKILGKVQFALFSTGNPVVCESCACNAVRETKLEKIIGFAREHGINYGQPMSYWMLGCGE